MAGLLRNLLAIALALFSTLFRRGEHGVQSTVHTSFWVMPWDAGLKVLKSDKYLTLAESAQLDFLIKTRLMGPLLSRRYAFVNGAQLVKFSRSVGMFRRVQVASNVVFWDDKWAYFAHRFFVSHTLCGEVVVKMKFKHGRMTVNPSELLGALTIRKPHFLQLCDDALDELKAA